jgi:hypothetical protein
MFSFNISPVTTEFKRNDAYTLNLFVGLHYTRNAPDYMKLKEDGMIY